MAARVEGVERFSARLANTPRRVNSEVVDTMRKIGADLQGKSQRAAPVDEGALRASAYNRLSSTPNGAELEVGFEGLPYIIVQHEGGWLNFMGNQGPKKIQEYHRGGGSKFLEGPFAENLPGYKARVRDAMRKGLRG